MAMKITQTAVAGAVVLAVVAGYLLYQSNQNNQDDIPPRETLTMTDEEKNMMETTQVANGGSVDSAEMPAFEPEDEFDYAGELVDVSGGSASGFAMANFTNASDEGYKMYATFENLPELEEGFFYEGWVVRRGNDFDVLSSGVAEKVDGKYVNTFVSNADLTDHDFYVLTLEPDDGDPAPAEHILEGTMIRLTEPRARENFSDEME